MCVSKVRHISLVHTETKVFIDNIMDMIHLTVTMCDVPAQLHLLTPAFKHILDPDLIFLPYLQKLEKKESWSSWRSLRL